MPPRGASITGALVGIGAALGLLYFLRDIVVPLFVALILLALLDGLGRMLAKLWPTAPRWLLLFVTSAVVLALLGACVAAIGYGAAQFVADAPALVDRLDNAVNELAAVLQIADPPRLAEFVSADAVMSVVRPAVSGLGDLLAATTLVVLFLGFLLASRPMFARKLDIVAKEPARAHRFRKILGRIAQGAGDYMWVQTVTGAIYAVACGIGFAIIGLDNVLFWTVLIFLLSYIPVLGAAIASIAPALFALVQFPTYWQAIAVFAVVQVFASLVGNVLLPKMQADKQNIDPTISIISIALWTMLWGMPGAFLAIPLTVMLMVVFDQFEETRWAAVLISNDGVPNAT